MEPTATLPLQDPATTAAIFALLMAIVKVVEKIVSWATSKIPSKASKSVSAKVNTIVHLDPGVSQAISETGRNVREMHAVLNRVDLDGTPMVYSSRSDTEHLRQTALIMQEVSRTMERIVDSLERLETKFEHHDRADTLSHSRIEDSLERVEKQVA